LQPDLGSRLPDIQEFEMANYSSPTTVEPFIPTAVITPADSLLLDALFQSEPAADAARYFFAEEGLQTEIDLDADKARAALERSPDTFAARLLTEALKELGPDETFLTIVLDDRWELLFQDIIRRSPTLDHLIVTTAFTCSRMRPGAFGGAAVFITADAVESISTQQFIEEALAKLQLTTGRGHS
jgi:hypothetical protein